MKKTIAIVVMLAMAAGICSARTASELKSAAVYLGGATLTHTASVQVKAGSQEIEIEGLSPSIDVGSIKVKADKGVLITASEFNRDYMTDVAWQKKLNVMKDSLSALKNALAEANNKVDIDNKLLALLSEGIENNMKNRPNGTSTAEINSNLDMFRKNAASIYADIQKDGRKVEETKTAIEDLEKRIEKASAEARKRCGVLKLSLNAPSDAKVNFTISYYTGQASWWPLYDINVASTDKPVALQAKARVQQNTGLDWKGVALTLSNGRPNISNTAPLFTTWYLNFPKIYAQSRMKAAMNTMTYASVAADMALMDGDEEVAMEEAAMDMGYYVASDESGINVSYEIALPYDIPGNGSSCLIDLKKYDIAADYHYYTAPKLSEEVYLMAKLSDWEQYGLLSGEATVNYDGSYIGKTWLNAGTADANLELTLGTDARVAVKREAVKNLKTKATLGGSTTEYKGWKTTIRNSRNNAIKITVKDQYPVAADEAIEVRTAEISPAATYNRTENGVVTWEVEIPAGQTAEFVLSYSVKYPKDKTVNL